MTTKAKGKAAKRSGPRPTKWKDEWVLICYEHAKTGMTNASIAKAIGVQRMTFRGYLRDYPLLVKALERAREFRSGARGFNFGEYVYRRLPKPLQDLWDDIQRVEYEPNGLARMEAMLENKGRRARQHLFVHALVAFNFNASEACKAVNIPLMTFRGWLLHDPQFEELINEMEEHRKNFIEGSLMDLVAARDPAAVIFANKAVNGDRGYNPGKTSKVEVNGTIDHQHRVSVDELELPLETRIAIRDAMKARMEGKVVETTAKRISREFIDPADEDDDE